MDCTDAMVTVTSLTLPRIPVKKTPFLSGLLSRAAARPPPQPWCGGWRTGSGPDLGCGLPNLSELLAVETACCEPGPVPGTAMESPFVPPLLPSYCVCPPPPPPHCSPAPPFPSLASSLSKSKSYYFVPKYKSHTKIRRLSPICL